MLEEIIKWLAAIGAAVSYLIPSKEWFDAGARAFRLEQDLPQWVVGLIILILVLLVLKVVTNILFKIALFVGVVILLLILLSALHAPVAEWLSSFNW